MTDLLGDPIAPTSDNGFAAFWRVWPVGDRKVAKAQCAAKWAKLGCSNNAAHIIAHVEYLKTTEQWQKGIIPMPATYLNQQRWLDWQPAPERPKQPDALTVIKAHKGAAPTPEIRAKLAELRRVIPSAKHAQQG